MENVTAFQLAMVLIAALFGVINVFIGIMINAMLAEQRATRGLLREIERQYFPRVEFQRFEDQTLKERHALKERVSALEIRMGDWKSS